MRIVGTASGIEILASDDAYFSYFNSPYIGHVLGSAVDIYPAYQEWGGPVPSPVSGKVIRIRKICMGAPKVFPSAEYDYGIAILPDGADTNIVRVMHCESKLQEGEKIDVGDILGHLFRSRYFNYWTGPHYHVEIMSMDSFPRSSQSYPLDMNLDTTPQQFGTLPLILEVLLTDVSQDRAIGYPQKRIHARVSGLYGLSVQEKGKNTMGIVDAGISHYNHGGIIGRNDLQNGDEVYLGPIPVGEVVKTRSGVSSFRRGPMIAASIDGVSLRGLSCFLYPSHFVKRGMPPLVLVPERYGDFIDVLEQDSVGLLETQSCSNMDKT
jgi:hypothetical protein